MLFFWKLVLEIVLREVAPLESWMKNKDVKITINNICAARELVETHLGSQSTRELTTRNPPPKKKVHEGWQTNSGKPIFQQPLPS